MDRSEVAELVAEQWETDALCVPVKTETRRAVYVAVDSVTRVEWFDGSRQGLNPELRFRMFRYDYNGEKIIDYQGVRFTVYRTFFARDDSIEIYTQRKQGNV